MPWLCGALAVTLVSVVAHAQTPSEADIAFKKGRELLKAGKFAEACVEAWGDAQASLGPGQDHTAVVRHWENLAGTEFGKKQPAS